MFINSKVILYGDFILQIQLWQLLLPSSVHCIWNMDIRYGCEKWNQTTLALPNKFQNFNLLLMYLRYACHERYSM